MLEALFLRVVTLSLTCSAVLLPLLLLSRRMHHRYAARTCYFLWLLLAVRLVLPIQITLTAPAVTVEAPVHEVAVIQPAKRNVQAPAQASAPLPVVSDAAPLPATATVPARTLSVTELLARLWLAGGIAYGLWQIAAYGLARRRLLGRAVPAGLEERLLLESLKAQLGCSRRVALCRAEGVNTPMMLGLLRPVILLPRQAMDPRALSVVLRHELTHLKRGDVAYKLLLLAANGVHWFNPLAWWMAREGARNLELCCDDDVVRDQGEGFRRMYGEILLDTAAGAGRAPALSTRFSGKEQLKERLKNLFKTKKNSAALVCLILAVTLLCGSLVVCRAAGGPGRVSETEAMDLLEASIRYDPDTGRLSFAIPDVETPSQPWELRIAGRAEFDDGMGMSLHYHTDTQWEPGGRYDEDLSQVAGALTQLTMDVTLGITQRSIDLMAWIRGEGGLLSGRYGMAVQPGNGPIFVPALTLDASGRTFTFFFDPASSYLARGSYTVSDGLLTAVTNDGLDKRYVFRIVDGQTLAFVKDQSSPITTYMGPEVYDGALFVAGGTVYENAVYEYSLILPTGWAGQWEAVEGAKSDLVTFYRSSARQADDPTAGVIMTLCVCDWEDFKALYGDKDLEGAAADGGPRIILLGSTRGNQAAYLHVEAAEGQDGLARMRREAAALTSAAFTHVGGAWPAYRNETYGFTLNLPESWAGQWAAVDTSQDQSGDFYGDVAFYCTAVGGEPGALLLELGVWPAERQDPLTGRERLLGHTDGCWVYAYHPQTDMPALAGAAEAAVRQYDTMYQDAQALDAADLTFLEGARPLVYENDFYGFNLYLPEDWAELGEITEIGNDEVRLRYNGFGGGIYGGVATLVIQREPLQELTARIRLLSSQEGCYVYLSMDQTSWPEDAGQAKIDEYMALYDAIEALTVEDLVYFDQTPEQEEPPAGTPEAIAQVWLDERVARFVEFGYSYTSGRVDALEYAWAVGGYTAYRFRYSIQQEGAWIRDYEQTPYLILYQGILYEVVFLADPADPGPYKDPMAAFRAVLDGREGFLDNYTGARTLLSQLDVSDNPNKSPYTAIKRFTMADLDQDGVPEVILERAQYPENAYLILRYEDGNVYGYEAYYRWFMPLKADGTIYFSGGAADGGYGRFLFMEGALLTDDITYSASYGGWDVMAYFVDREPATLAQFQAACRQIDAQPDAVWHGFSESNVRAALE